MMKLAFVVAAMSWGLASAQEPPKLQPLPDVPPPPKMSTTPTPADDEEATSVTIRQEGDTKIEEFRTRGGKLYAIRVTPRFGKPYMMIDADGKGAMTNAGEINGGVRPSQWTILEF